MAHKIYRYLFWIWIVIIITLTSIPGSSIPKNDIFGKDKLGHFMIYTILSLIFYLKQKSKLLLDITIIKQLFLFSVIAPIIDELHQLMIQGRDCSIYDMMADFLGFFAVIVIIVLRNSFISLKSSH